MLHARTFATTCVRRVTSSSSSLLRNTKAPFNVLFCGTDEFAIPSFQKIFEREGLCQSAHVLTSQGATQRWSRAKHKVNEPPLKVFAESLDVSVSMVDAAGMRSTELPPPFDSFAESNLLIAASFGHLIPERILSRFPASQALNVHPSLLPRYRGAAPMQWAIANGEQETGVTIQTMGKRFDTGDILSQTKYPLDGHEDYPGLRNKLRHIAADLLLDTVENLQDRIANAKPQTTIDENIPRAPKLVRSLSLIDWNVDDALTIEARHRAFGYLFPVHTNVHVEEAVKRGKAKIRHGIQLHKLTGRGMVRKDIKEFLDEEPVGLAVYDDKIKAFVCRCVNSQYLTIFEIQRDNRKLMEAKAWQSGNIERYKGFKVVQFIN